jgi:CRP-like cAMP-binding protein
MRAKRMIGDKRKKVSPRKEAKAARGKCEVKDWTAMDVVAGEELADMASVTRFTASRLMSEWHRRGILTKTRGKVLLRAPEKLFTR